MVQSDEGYVTQVRQKPPSIWSSSRNEPSDWSMVPAVTLPAHVEHAPARHEYGRSMPAAHNADTTTREARGEQGMGEGGGGGRASAAGTRWDGTTGGPPCARAW